MKKRFLAILLVFALLLCGCSKETDAATPATNPATEPAPVTEPAPATEPAATDSGSLGVLEGGTYTNTYVGFGFSLDENWTIYPADQLQELPEDISSIFDGTELENYNVPTIMDILAENLTDLTTMNVLYQKLTMQERLTYLTMTEVQIIDLMISDYYDALVASYANAGIIVESITTKQVTFLGQPRTALYTVASIQDIPYYILQLYDFQLGPYSITTTVASYVEDNTLSLLDLFFATE